MRIDNEGEAPTTMHIVIDNPEDQVYVTYRGVTISIYLGEQEPELVFYPQPIEVDIMPEDDLLLTPPAWTGDGDGLRIYHNGEPKLRYNRTYSKGI